MEADMCMFCAAIPATAAVGARLNAKQQGEIHEAQEDGENIKGKPIKIITAGVIVVLLAGSLFYHTHYSTFF